MYCTYKYGVSVTCTVHTLSVHTRKRSYLIEVGETAMQFKFRKVSRYAELGILLDQDVKYHTYNKIRLGGIGPVTRVALARNRLSPISHSDSVHTQ